MEAFLLWLAIIIGAIAFLILYALYVRGFFQPRPSYRLDNLPHPSDRDFGLTIGSLSDSYIEPGTITGFWVGADDINRVRLEGIYAARESIDFETYTMTPGRRADDFAQALITQARKGIKVRVLADSFGARAIPQEYWGNLQREGIEVRIFNQFSWRNPIYYFQRNHRKLLLIDRAFAFIGGAGVSDDWDGLPEIGDTAPWLDYEVKIEGNVISRLIGIYWQHWLDAGATIDLIKRTVPVENSDAPTILITTGEDPSFRDASIRALYQSSIQSARERIWIASPYFLPNPNTRKILVTARQRGIDVRILTMGYKSDKRFIHYTAQELYEEMLRGGVKIHEYQPSMMHAKILFIDNHWVSIGSANFDARSFFQNDEMNLTTAQPELLNWIENFFIEAFDKSKLVRLKDWQHRSLKGRVIGNFWRIFYWEL